MFVLFLFFCHCERNIKKLEAEKQYNGLITDPLVRHVIRILEAFAERAAIIRSTVDILEQPIDKSIGFRGKSL